MHGFVIDRCFFDIGGRSALWYSDHLKMTDTRIDAPKMFREMHDIEVENVEMNDSALNGEYLGWHSRNLRLVNCHITGEQPLCYAHDLVLENCTFGPDCDRAFEYSSVQATIKGAIGGVKNPRTGCITAESYGEIILDENIKAPADCELRLWEEKRERPIT